MHHIHAARVLVVRAHPSGEASGVFELLTREYGLVFAKAQGVRYLKSKSRFALQELCIVDAELVKGRETWRVIRATLVESLYHSLGEGERLDQFGRIVSLARRLVRGEHAIDAAFDAVIESSRALMRGADPKAVALLSELRMLSELGYVDMSRWGAITHHHDMTDEDIATVLRDERDIQAAVASAVTASQL